MKGLAKTIVAGASHMNALVEGRFALTPQIREIFTHEHLLALDGPWPRNDAYWSALVSASKRNNIALVWGGNEHNSFYFFEAAYKFDFSSRNVSRILNGIQIVAQRTIRNKFWTFSIQELRQLLGKLVREMPNRIVIVGTPPPKKDNDKLRALLASEPAFLEWAAQIGEKEGSIRITNPFVRLKLWYLLQDMLAEEAKAANGVFVAVPAETQDEDGFLREDYWAQDVTHANSLYGNIILKKILEECER